MVDFVLSASLVTRRYTMAHHEESRWQHLLAPIRDLAQNWNTDIAKDLQDYLAQLEEISFSFDGGATSLNFAEGARLSLACSPKLRAVSL
jgi:hypothetical protein